MKENQTLSAGPRPGLASLIYALEYGYDRIALIVLGQTEMMTSQILPGMVLFASSMCVRAGSTYQAAFEIVRQVW